MSGIVTPYLTTQEAADYLCCSKSFLEKGRVTGLPKIPYHKLGKKVLYDRKTLNEFLGQNIRTTTSEEVGNEK